jgi:hypothetical protein
MLAVTAPSADRVDLLPSAYRAGCIGLPFDAPAGPSKHVRAVGSMAWTAPRLPRLPDTAELRSIALALEADFSFGDIPLQNFAVRAE